METQKNIEDDKLFNMFTILGELLSINYSCLRISNQNRKLNQQAPVVTSGELFSSKQSAKDARIEDKLSEAVELRNEIFNSILDGWTTEKEQITAGVDIDHELKNKQVALIKAYNAYFGTKKTFKDIFSNFNTLDPELLKIIQVFETNKAVRVENEGLNHLLQTYYEYIEVLKLQMKVKGFEDLFSLVKNDLDATSGRPSPMFGKAKNYSTSTMSGSQIEKFLTHAKTSLKNVENEIAAQNKKLIPLYKKVRKNFNDYETHNKISQIKSEIFNLLETERVAKQYLNLALSLLERLVYANTDYDTTFASKLSENLGDMFSGINIFKKDNRLHFEKVYVHNLEKSYLAFLGSLFENSPVYSIKKADEIEPTKQI